MGFASPPTTLRPRVFRVGLAVTTQVVLFLLHPVSVHTQPPAPTALSFDEAYREGLRRLRYEEWDEAVELLCQALDARAEDGELVRDYGAWYVPYLPQYYLGVALQELECEAQALVLFQTSILNRREVRRARSQRRDLEQRLSLAEDVVHQMDPTAWPDRCNRYCPTLTQSDDDSQEESDSVGSP